MADESLKASELERFARNLENFAKTHPGEEMYYRFHGILEGQIVTLQCCGVITRQGAVKLSQQVAEVVRSKRGDSQQRGHQGAPSWCGSASLSESPGDD